ncbi:hypothetical protein COUCH_12565 [Couchioplanes caeruleus]|uniref:type IV toxin-antitoxin system AbiEi family antitoxin n=1 Tax=Couchioplanes caeruleus TaxID=56438 RepID=UPI0020BF640E|nr:type IV toxin-antitoxin system AbiEi family antitoxin [Couchioplanes caeruleus]UQU67048.1 hypothetical protein COUCH_12565 [Couchioplanes caeruleus]
MSSANATENLIGTAEERLRELGITLRTRAWSPGDETIPPDAGIDAVATLSRGVTDAQYAVVAKHSMTLSSLLHHVRSALPFPLLLISDRISRRSATAFRDAGIQFIDRLGNAFITFGDVLVDVRGRTETNARDLADHDAGTTPHQPANIFSPRRSQVILALLTWPELRAATVRAIADASGVSIGQAHDALAQLERAGFLTPTTGRLIRGDDLLDYWAAAYPTGLSRRLDIARYHGDISAPLRQPPLEQSVYLSGESAEGTIVARPATLTIYIDTLDLNRRMAIANRWSSSPDRTPNIFVRHKFWTPPHTEERPPLTSNAPWPLVYADLLSTGDARLREAAKAWRARCARPDGM